MQGSIPICYKSNTCTTVCYHNSRDTVAHCQEAMVTPYYYGRKFSLLHDQIDHILKAVERLSRFSTSLSLSAVSFSSFSNCFNANFSARSCRRFFHGCLKEFIAIIFLLLHKCSTQWLSVQHNISVVQNFLHPTKKTHMDSGHAAEDHGNFIRLYISIPE